MSYQPPLSPSQSSSQPLYPQQSFPSQPSQPLPPQPQEGLYYPSQQQPTGYPYPPQSMQPPMQPQQQSGFYPPQQQPQQQSGFYPPQQQPQQQSGFYPPQQQPPKKKKHTLRNILIGVVAAIVVIAIIAVAAKNAGKPNSTSSTTTNTATTNSSTQPVATQPAAPSTFKVGQVVTVANTWQVTVLSATTNTGSEFDTPKSGNVYLFVAVSLKNISGQSQDASSIIQWTLKDASGQKYDETIVSSAPASPDGTVAAGSSLKGTIAYEVPKTIKSFEIDFQSGFASSDLTVWNFTVK